MSHPVDLEKILNSLPVPFFYQDLNGKIIGCNQSFAELTDHSIEQLIGANAYDFALKQNLGQHQSADKDLLTTRLPQQYEVENERNRYTTSCIVHKTLFNDNNTDYILTTLFDITEQKQVEEHLFFQATHDELTGLTNRSEMQASLIKNMARAERYKEPFSLLLIDLDRFKIVNDNYGHSAGDKVLKVFADIAQDIARDSDLLARWGGEEFILLLTNTDAIRATHIAERLRAATEENPITVNAQDINVTVSIGVASFPDDGKSTEELISRADEALYEAKRNGRNRIEYANRRDSGIFSIGTQLQRALQENKLLPAYQPIVDLKTGDIRAEEALARIILGDDKITDAESFIQAASDLQLSHRVDHLITRKTIERCVRMVSQGDKRLHFINISADLLRHPELMDNIIQFSHEACQNCEFSDKQLKPLVIEITEREFIGNVQSAREFLAPLLDIGLQIAIDDFGSGYSSFQYLADLPVSYLKIEGNLIKRMMREPKVKRIIHGIRDVARDLDLITIAEHIEDEHTADILREVGIDWGQGYLFGKARFD
jgi:diguanylate cyclase (GGDEF)-like protein/PAS domain S-box-containing protein